MAEGPPRKEDVMISLLEVMRQPTEKKPQKEEAPKRANQDTWSLWYLRSQRMTRN